MFTPSKSDELRHECAEFAKLPFPMSSSFQPSTFLCTGMMRTTAHVPGRPLSPRVVKPTRAMRVYSEELDAGLQVAIAPVRKPCRSFLSIQVMDGDDVDDGRGEGTFGSTAPVASVLLSVPSPPKPRQVTSVSIDTSPPLLWKSPPAASKPLAVKADADDAGGVLPMSQDNPPADDVMDVSSVTPKHVSVAAAGSSTLPPRMVCTAPKPRMSRSSPSSPVTSPLTSTPPLTAPTTPAFHPSHADMAACAASGASPGRCGRDEEGSDDATAAYAWGRSASDPGTRAQPGDETGHPRDRGPRGRGHGYDTSATTSSLHRTRAAPTSSRFTGACDMLRALVPGVRIQTSHQPTDDARITEVLSRCVQCLFDRAEAGSTHRFPFQSTDPTSYQQQQHQQRWQQQQQRQPQPHYATERQSVRDQASHEDSKEQACDGCVIDPCSSTPPPTAPPSTPFGLCRRSEVVPSPAKADARYPYATKDDDGVRVTLSYAPSPPARFLRPHEASIVQMPHVTPYRDVSVYISRDPSEGSLARLIVSVTREWSHWMSVSIPSLGHAICGLNAL